MDRNARKGLRMKLRTFVDGRRSGPGAAYLYGYAGGILIASDDEPASEEEAAPSEAKRRRSARRVRV